MPYLHTLIADVPTAANAGHYARIVADRRKRRNVADLGAQLTQLAASRRRHGRGRRGRPGAARRRAVAGLAGADPARPGRTAPRPSRSTRCRGWLADMVARRRRVHPNPARPRRLHRPGLPVHRRRRPRRGRGPRAWREPLNLYTVIALPPGSRKSAVFAAMTAPILAAEQALIERTAPAIVEAEIAAKVAGKAPTATAHAAAAAYRHAQADTAARRGRRPPR